MPLYATLAPQLELKASNSLRFSDISRSPDPRKNKAVNYGEKFNVLAVS
jgi:hypothetical protein